MMLLGRRRLITTKKVRYNFDGDITIYTVKKLKKILFDEIDNNRDIELDLGDVIKFDTAGLQLLLHLNTEAKGSGRRIFINQKSHYVEKLFSFFNVNI